MITYKFGLSRIDQRECANIENVSSYAILNTKGRSWDAVASMEGPWALRPSISLLYLRSSPSLTSIFLLCGPFSQVLPWPLLQRQQYCDRVDRGCRRVARHLVVDRTQEDANVDRHHHSPLSRFWLFNAETLKKTCKGRGEIVELNISEKHVVKKDEKFRRVCVRSRPSCLADGDHTGRTDSRASRTDV